MFHHVSGCENWVKLLRKWLKIIIICSSLNFLLHMTIAYSFLKITNIPMLLKMLSLLNLTFQIKTKTTCLDFSWLIKRNAACKEKTNEPMKNFHLPINRCWNKNIHTKENGSLIQLWTRQCNIIKVISVFFVCKVNFIFVNNIYVLYIR